MTDINKSDLIDGFAASLGGAFSDRSVSSPPVEEEGDNDYDPLFRIQCAADDVHQLRACDVWRVFAEAPEEEWEGLKDYILFHRPDLASEVKEGMSKEEEEGDDDYDPLFRIQCAADDVHQLRAGDVWRVFAEAPEEEWEGLKDYILFHRPDLASEVKEGMSKEEVNEEPAAVDSEVEAFAALVLQLHTFAPETLKVSLPSLLSEKGFDPALASNILFGISIGMPVASLLQGADPYSPLREEFDRVFPVAIEAMSALMSPGLKKLMENWKDDLALAIPGIIFSEATEKKKEEKSVKDRLLDLIKGSRERLSRPAWVEHATTVFGVHRSSVQGAIKKLLEEGILVVEGDKLVAAQN